MLLSPPHLYPGLDPTPGVKRAPAAVTAATVAPQPRARRRDPQRWSRRARGALTSVVLHAALLGLLSVWALPHLRGPAEARSAHVQTRWAQVARVAAPTAELPAPPVPEVELAPNLEQDWEPDWKPPSVASHPGPGSSRPKPDLAAARRFRTFAPPKAQPKKAQPKKVQPKKVQPKKAQPTRAVAKAVTPRKAAAPRRTAPLPRRRQPVLVAPRVESQPKVSLPSRCRRRGHQGTTRLQLEVDAQGRVKSSRVVTSAGCKRLDERAREAGLRYRFRPGTRDGRAAVWLVYVEIEFGTAS